MEKILIIGAGGQLGMELTSALQEKWGKENVLVSDIRETPWLIQNNFFLELDVLDKEKLYQVIQEKGITQIYNLAAILSATGESKPLFTWKLNMEGHLNVLEAARELDIQKVFWPSSIAVFGPDTPKEQVPQSTVCNPVTVYGISKLAGEHWCAYYRSKWGVDVRSLRYPGLIGYKAKPGGGTTDYAVEIFHKALAEKEFECYLKPDTRLPMMYMPDAIRAALELMEAPAENIQVHDSYNLSALSFCPVELAGVIQQFIPDFKMVYKPDARQKIAEGWPKSINDTRARQEWGWQEEYHLEEMAADMLSNLKKMKKEKAPSESGFPGVKD